MGEGGWAHPLDRVAAYGALRTLQGPDSGRRGRAPVRYHYRQVVEAAHDFLLRAPARSRCPWAVGGLVWGQGDDRHHTLLIAPHPSTGWEYPWMTPGGKVEPGERLLQALSREVREEVGLSVVRAALTALHENRYTDGVHALHHFFFQFRIVVEAGTPTVREGEVTAAQWFDHLPQGLAWRREYVQDFGQGPPPAPGRPLTDGP